MNVRTGRNGWRLTAVGAVVAVAVGVVGSGGPGSVDPADAAGETVTIGTVTITPDPVVRASAVTEVEVSASISTSGFSTPGTSSTTTPKNNCLRPGGQGNPYKRTFTISSVEASAITFTVTASDGGTPAPLSLVDGKYVGTLAVPVTDGAKSVGVNATAAQSVSTTSYDEVRTYSNSDSTCSGSYTASSTTSSTTTQNLSDSDTKSTSYLVDLLPPVVTADFAGGGTPSAPTGGEINATVDVSSGLKDDSFTVTLNAYLDGNLAFTGDTTGTIGNNGSKSFANLGLAVSCSAPVGTYTLEAEVSGLSDVAGDDFDAVTVDIGEFEVTPSVNLVGDTTVFGFVDTDGDGISEYTNLDETGFTAVQAKRKVNTDPGAFHATNLLKATGQCNDETMINFDLGDPATYDMTLTAPTGFEFIPTGKTFAKVYAGLLPAGVLFDYEKPALSLGEVTSLLGDPAWWQGVTFDANNRATKIEVRLDALGSLPGDGFVFLRVRMRYVGTSVPGSGQGFEVVGSVSVDGYNDAPMIESKTGTYVLVHDPQ